MKIVRFAPDEKVGKEKREGKVKERKKKKTGEVEDELARESHL